jgi:hypothetical protein
LVLDNEDAMMTNPLIRRGDWVVVCDGAKALVLHNAGNVMSLKLQARDVFEQPDLKTSKLGTDAPGRRDPWRRDLASST